MSRFKILGRDINHALINISGEVPHELFFIKLLFRELANNPDIVYPLTLFIKEYYPEYRWNNGAINPLLKITLEAALCNMNFIKVYEHEIEPIESLTDSMLFGEIVTEFLIRYCNYSLIDFSSNHIILTAQSDCEKRFEEYLKKGYSVHRYAKLYYDKYDYKLYKLPVFPTEDFDIPIEEIIESSDGEHRLVQCKRK